jgi:uncharacterized membrane protein
MKGYGKIDPTFPDRIMRMAEQQGQHRREMEASLLQADLSNESADQSERRLGQVFALVVAVAGLVATIWLASLKQPWVAGVVGGGTLVSLVTVFVLGRRSTARDSHAPTPPTDTRPRDNLPSYSADQTNSRSSDS